MPSLRGIRRLCVLITTCIFPLLADVPAESIPTGGSRAAAAGDDRTMVQDEPQAHDNKGRGQTLTEPELVSPESIWSASERIMEDESLTKLPLLTVNDWADGAGFGSHYNIVVPFRPLKPYIQSSRRPKTTATTATTTIPKTSTNESNDAIQDEERQTSPTLEPNATTNSDAIVSSLTGNEEDIIPQQDDNDDVVNTTINATDVQETVVQPQNATQFKQEQEDISTSITREDEEASNDLDGENVKTVKFDFASKSAGALILEKSAGWKGASSLLTSDNDRYAIIPCSETSKSVVISLSEDVLVKTVVLANYERYSSTVKDFQLLGSQTMGKWVDLGTYTAKHASGTQEFELNEYSWARYLKVRVLSHYGDEHYLTISQISVHGDTMVQGFHEHWEEEQQEEINNREEFELDESAVNTHVDTSEEMARAETSSDANTEEMAAKNRRTSNVTVEISDFKSNNLCRAELDSMCPKELNFEMLMYLYATNQSHFESISALGAAAVCRNSVTFNHVTFPALQIEPVAPATVLATKRREAPGTAGVISSTSDSVSLNTGDSPVIIQIQHLIKSASGIDVDLSKVNALFHGESSEGQITTEESGVAVPETRASLEPVTPSKMNSQNHKTTDTVSKESKTPSPNPSATKDAKENGKTTISKEEWNILLKRLEKVRGSECLKNLDFTEFRKRVAAGKGGNGNAGNQNSAGGSVEMQPIFKRLTDEIKTLHGTLALQEDFLKNAVSCYQRVLIELVVQQEEHRGNTEKRLEDLERIMNAYLGWFQFMSECLSTVSALMSSVVSQVGHLWPSTWLHDVSDSLVILVIVVFVLVVSRIAIFACGRWIRRRVSSNPTEMKPSQTDRDTQAGSKSNGKAFEKDKKNKNAVSGEVPLLLETPDSVKH